MKEKIVNTSNFWFGRTVFVTGASGIVGSWLVKELLSYKANIVVLISNINPQTELYRSTNIKDVAVVNGKLEDFWVLEEAINKYEVDTIFHLGAQTIVGRAHRFPLSTFESNIRGTYNLLEASRIHSNLVKRIVIASSDKAYGENQNLPYTEDMPLIGRHPYEVSKTCTDLITQSFYHTYKLPITIARCGNIYGGGDLNWSRIVPSTIRSYINTHSPILRSNGEFLRDYIYVKDVVRAYLKLAECLVDKEIAGQAFNFSMESPLTVLEIVSAIAKLMDCEHIKPEIQNVAKGEIPNQYLCAEKAKKLLGWQPYYSLQAGLEETINWYRGFFNDK